MTVTIHHGDCSEVIRTLADNSIDSCATDPPYALVSITKRFGKTGSEEAKFGKDGAYKRAARGFMGKQWDTGDVAFSPEFWAEVLRVLRPGAHVVAFGGTRTYHRLACAIEDAGFEIRDAIMWHYGSGFPKSHNPAKALDGKICCCENRQTNDPESHTVNSMRNVRDASAPRAFTREATGSDILQPIVPEQNICSASSANGKERSRKEVPEQGREGIEKWRVEGRGDLSEATRQLCERQICEVPTGTTEHGPQGRLCDGASAGDGALDQATIVARGNSTPYRSRALKQTAIKLGTVAGQPESQTRGAWPICRGCGQPIVPGGLGTALKPATEIIVLARKPLAGTVAANVLEFGTGALNIGASRVDSEKPTGWAGAGAGGNTWNESNMGLGNDGEARPVDGRWPANVIHDGSDEVIAAFPNSDGQAAPVAGREPSSKTNSVYGQFDGRPATQPRGDLGSAARFFYSAKADAGDRLESKHPTVKPVDLMAYLIRMITPPGGVVLDPFAGSGTTGMACMRESFDAVLIEREAEYVADIKHRIAHVHGTDAPLFAGIGT